MVKVIRKIKKSDSENYIKFLGTAGARFVMIKQLRASGGLWVSYKGTNVIVDPGPGSIVRCSASKPKLDPTTLDGIILTHKHLDHSNDINVMIEAMTEGGFKKRGTVFVPADALEIEPVILPHTKSFPDRIIYLKEGEEYSIENIRFATPKRHLHTVETYGLKFLFDKISVSLIADTRYFEGIEDYYKSDIVIINLVFYEPRPGIDHLNFEEAKQIIRNINPSMAILTHFGMSMLKHKPHELAEELKANTGINVVAAYDGMKLVIP
ncbi:MAG: MBL fold metallo-hydrolase [Candidatus Omnitrophica bacterium]|nr:MBL fold metallo-hydrolase [Candidatus Omnitrophota bacterium]HOX53992.1 MBL fold metallo-hydrolase [Candidatus Omnitrophota bacterium]